MKSLGFYGASGTVTGSCFVLSDGANTRILIDCGMFQGSDEITQLNHKPLGFDPTQLTAVILTHAHLDHCGRLPLLTKHGYRGPIYMTEATRALLELTLKDAVKVAQQDEAIPPMYSENDIADVLSCARLVEYGAFIDVGQFHVIFRDAGHILGSASIEVHHVVHTDGVRRIVFSGDLGNSPEDLVRPTEFVDNADVVIMESTYGDRTHSDEDPLATLAEETREIEKSGGTLLIPSFSIERAQELLHNFDHLKKSGKIKPQTRVFLDSPMAIRATSIYKRYKHLYNPELTQHAKEDDPFHFPGLYLSETGFESRKIKRIREPKVIIAGSGMMTGGRILYHAVDFLPLKNTRLLFVGFQGEETLGRAILEGASTVQIGEHTVTINAHVRKSSGMSSHADQPRLLKWLSHIKNVKHVYLVHGEEVPRKALATLVTERIGIEHVHMPRQGQEMRLADGSPS